MRSFLAHPRRTPFGLACAAIMALAAVPLPAPAQVPPRDSGAANAQLPSGRALRAFPTPEDAVRALIAAIQAPTMQPLEEILGRQVLASIPPAERQSTEMRRTTGEWLASQPFEISYPDGTQRDRAMALFGTTHVSLPAPLVRTARGWTFDPVATSQALRERRVGTNEANTIHALRELARAQERYRLSNRGGDGVLQYAMRIGSSAPGRLDGLVARDTVPGQSLDLLNPPFARAEGEPGDARFDPPGGYGYRILTAQGPNAEGGARSYLAGGKLTEGFAVVAWPVRPGQTGLSTFIMNQQGRIFERELGDKTLDEVRRLSAFDPGPGWDLVEEEE
jgi:hypothetical protein